MIVASWRETTPRSFVSSVYHRLRVGIAPPSRDRHSLFTQSPSRWHAEENFIRVQSHSLSLSLSLFCYPAKVAEEAVSGEKEAAGRSTEIHRDKNNRGA